jgi:beta-glucosidase
VTFPGAQAPYLRGFEKLNQLKAGEKRKATFDLRRKDLSEWDVVRQMWVVPKGKIEIAVGSSSTKIHLVSPFLGM